MASVLKGIITTKENGNAVFAIHFTIDNKRHLISYSLLTRQSVSVLKLGLPNGSKDICQGDFVFS